MGRNRQASSDVTRIPLSDGDWIEVFTDLNTGDQKKLEQAGIDPPVRINDGTIHHPVNWSRFEIEKVAIFLTDWSFRDEQDKPIVIAGVSWSEKLAAIRAIDTESFEEVNDAIQRHVIERGKAKKLARAAKSKEAGEQTPTTQTSQTSEGIAEGSAAISG